MSNYTLRIRTGVSVADVERQLAGYLPGLDVRLWPHGERQAVIGAPLVRALKTDYRVPGPGVLLDSLGVEEMRPISDAETVALLAGRDPDVLPPRPRVARPRAAALDWHLELVRVRPAWARLGGPDAIAWGDVKVAQIDTGYTMHPVFGFPGGTWVDTANAATFMPAAPSGEASMFPTELGGGLDNLQGVNGGHGTRIASAICGHDAQATGGVFYGVAPKVPLLPVRITDIVLINHAQREFQQAVNHALQAGAKVINVSLGVFAAVVLKPMKTAINQAYENGVIMVCAAGNHVNSVVAPARLNRTVAVAGITRTDAVWAGSSYGPQVDFSAPAADLRRASTNPDDKFSYGAGGDGTSYATAITSGAAALWLAHHGSALDQAYPHAWQRVSAFRQLARDTARRPAVWNPGSFGTGVLDVDALLAAPLPAASQLAKEPPA